MSGPQPTLTSPIPPPPEHRARKRRRRTMACTQCRSRKLRCDREYPVCGRCQKSKFPAACTYEDGFLWQQPNTVSSSVFSDRGSTGIVQDRTPVVTPPDSGLAAGSRPQPLPPLPLPFPQAQSQVQTGGEKRDRFLETVLGAPKAAGNTHQNPSGDPDMVPCGSRSMERDVRGERVQENGDGEGCLASPTQQLDISPKIMMRGKETKTRFNGSGIFAHLMSQVGF